jgi:histidine triad (HIT) family protein
VSACIFCDIVAGSAPARLVDDNGGALAFLDVNPAAEGHTLVVPRNHVEDIWELTGDESAAVWELTRMVARRVRAAFRPDGLTILQSNGEAAWQHVFHFHVHVVPRWNGDGLARPWTMAPGDPPALDRVARRLRETGR